MSASPHVLIAGAGIGGLTAALALARIGARVTVFERAEALAEIGAGLQLSPNATRILAWLGLLEAVAARAARPSGIRVRAGRGGHTLSTLSLANAERRWGAPYLVARRADLQAVLAAAAAAEPTITLELGTALAGFGTTETGVAVTTARGLIKRALTADALIGADGVRSTVRGRLAGPADAPTETGRTAWRALVPLDAAPAALRTAETSLWLGRDAHLVHYAVGNPARINVVAITRDATTRNATTRETTATDRDATWSRPGDPAILAARFAAWHPDARALIAAAPAWTTWPLHDRAPLPAWNAGPVALLGDAAHPILPFFAQGAAQAIEDAAALAAAVAASRDMPAALAAYSAARLARATRIQATSRELGRIYHLAGPAAAARDIAMKLAGPGRLMARYDWVYGA